MMTMWRLLMVRVFPLRLPLGWRLRRVIWKDRHE